MKNWKKLGIITLTGAMLLMPNEVSAASISLSDVSIKNVFLILAIVIILLLLYLGYKMDSNEGIKEPKEKKSKKKEFVDSKSNYVKPQVETTYVPDEKEYEEDNREYEVDNVNPDEISESVEYEEDDVADDETYTEPEKSLFDSSSNMDETISFDTNALNKEISDEVEEMEDAEDVGEEFDTSIIDKIDEEEEFGFATAVPKSKVEVEEYEETEEYGEEFDTSIIDQIDDEFEMEPVKNVEEMVNNIVEPEEETEFQGFSVGVPKAKEEPEEEVEIVEEVVVEEKPKKRYTKVTPKTTELDEDFMRQMEKNLEIGSEDGIKVTKVKSTKKTSTRRKKAE